MRPARILVLAASVAAAPAAADTVVTARTLRANSVIGPGDVALTPGDVPGAAGALDAVIGQEARVMLYAGRPVLLHQLAEPALVDRNQLVSLTFTQGGLRIVAEGRAMNRAAEGEVVRVLNLGSKTLVTGRVQPDGSVAVGGISGF